VSDRGSYGSGRRDGGGGGVALVTGAGRGVGRAVAVALARRGLDIGVVDLGGTVAPGYRTLDYELSGGDDLESTAAEVRSAGRRAVVLDLDVRDRSAVRAAVPAVEDALGPITHLVVASGVVSGVPIHRMTRSQWDEVVDTNLTGAFNVVKAVVPGMASRRCGSVVLTCGSESRRGVGGVSHASAAGWALVGMAKAVAMEVAAAGVTVQVAALGPVGSVPVRSSRSYVEALVGPADDPVGDGGGPVGEGGVDARLAARHPQGRPWVDVDEAAAVIEFLATGSRAMTGVVVDVDLGQAARNSA